MQQAALNINFLYSYFNIQRQSILQISDLKVYGRGTLLRFTLWKYDVCKNTSREDKICLKIMIYRPEV